jgi:hypothetical protein
VKLGDDDPVWEALKHMHVADAVQKLKASAVVCTAMSLKSCALRHHGNKYCTPLTFISLRSNHLNNQPARDKSLASPHPWFTGRFLCRNVFKSPIA